LIIAAFGCFLARQLHWGQRTLAATEADFRLLAEYCSDMVVLMGLADSLRFAVLRRGSWLDFRRYHGDGRAGGMNPEDVPRAQQTLTALSLGETEEARFTYRNRHRHRLKKEVWIELRCA
jgi:hypothetical protein